MILNNVVFAPVINKENTSCKKCSLCPDDDMSCGVSPTPCVKYCIDRKKIYLNASRVIFIRMGESKS